jgi:DNA polymerase-1
VEFADVQSDLFSEGWNPEAPAYMQELWKVLTAELEKHNALQLYQDIEIPTMHALAQMESVGIGVDQVALKKLHDFFEKEEKGSIATAYQSVGHEFNVASPKQLQTVLFEELRLPKTKRIKTGFSTDAESLEWLYETTKHPVLEALLRVREVGKLRTTVEGLLSAIASDQRIHSTFQQTTTATGRLSSTDPNLQNIPVRTEEGRKIRDCFVAQKPFVDLLTADYSQIEMRIMAHLSDDKELLEAFRTGEDLHSTVAAQVFGVKVSDVDADMRRQIKAMSYGLAYGLSSFGLAQQLDISPGDASALMAKYFERFGGIQDYLKQVVVKARELGYTETILGRRRYLPDLNHENRQRREIAERMALNAPIQGSAADIIKVAMLNVEHAINQQGLKSRLLLQVHDELIFEVAEGEHQTMEQLVRREMGSAYPLKAPLDVNVGFGKSWDLAAH